MEKHLLLIALLSLFSLNSYRAKAQIENVDDRVKSIICLEKNNKSAIRSPHYENKMNTLADKILNAKNERINQVVKQQIYFAKGLEKNANQQSSDVKTVHINAGELSNALSATEKYWTNDLTITGTIDARDFLVMRDSMPSLANINLTNTTIVSYTGKYGTDATGEIITYNANTVPQYAFYNSIIHRIQVYNTILLPSTITEIGDWSLIGQPSLVSFTIPSTVKTIGIGAFQYTGMSSIEIPSSVKIIKNFAFSFSKLTNITIPSSVDTIGAYSFSCDSSLTSANISAKYIDKFAFNNCISLNIINIPNSVIDIGFSAFNNCSALSTVNILNSVKTIRNCAFSGCKSLTSVTLPNSVITIGDMVFYNCTKLSSITIPSSVLYIGSIAFENCTSLTSISIPNSVMKIDLWAFSNCTALESVSIPGSTSIEDGAFEDCTSLATINVSESIPSIGEGAFKNTAWYNNQPDGLVYLKNYLYTYKGTMTAQTVDLNDNTIGIADDAFDGCTSLTTITIPSSVVFIGEYAFYSCTALYSINIPKSVNSIGRYAFSYTAWYNNQPDGLVYAGNCVITFKGKMSNDTTLVIKDGTVGIADVAFWGYHHLISIKIPNSVSSIGEGAFYWCNGLDSIKIPNSVTSIKEFTFSCCMGLTTIDLPNSIETIETWAFEDTKLSTINIPASVTIIGENAFQGCSNLTSIYVNNNNPSAIKLGSFVFCSEELHTGDSIYHFDFPFSTCVIHVPTGSKYLYTEADQWQDFANIEEFNLSSASNPIKLNSNINIFFNSSSRLLQINGINKPVFVSIYDINGKILINRTVMVEELLHLRLLPKGVYIVKAVVDNDIYNQEIIIN
jgi:hypothetical protein